MGHFSAGTPVYSPGVSSDVSGAEALMGIDRATPESTQPPLAPSSALSISPVDENLVGLLQA